MEARVSSVLVGNMGKSMMVTHKDVATARYYDKRGTDKRGTRQTWDDDKRGTDKRGTRQTWDATNVGLRQTWDHDKRRTTTNVGRDKHGTTTNVGRDIYKVKRGTKLL